MSIVNEENKHSSDMKDIPGVRAFPVENEFSFFCKYDELPGVIACPGVDLLPLAESCYINRERVFGPAKD